MLERIVGFQQDSVKPKGIRPGTGGIQSSHVSFYHAGNSKLFLRVGYWCCQESYSHSGERNELCKKKARLVSIGMACQFNQCLLFLEIRAPLSQCQSKKVILLAPMMAMGQGEDVTMLPKVLDHGRPKPDKKGQMRLPLNKSLQLVLEITGLNGVVGDPALELAVVSERLKPSVVYILSLFQCPSLDSAMTFEWKPIGKGFGVKHCNDMEPEG
ncbi:hypothetical protein WISP_85552 [Willisornis vidua]|uniref:Uncharacterized protein n=1 Tax=Willisornis vidua TaxID=1566151 RepID=A0ABQ9D880_9PASS|nr:hypothetical protein WISP_85552 [Willisornis vidua]